MANKQSKPNVPNVVLDACKIPNVAALEHQVAQQTNLIYTPSTDGGWGSSTEQGETTIFYTESAHAPEAYAHELLHAKLKLTGFRQHLIAVAKHPCQPECGAKIRALLAMLDNELQHHKMERDFASLGLNSDFFYRDDDVSTLKRVRRQLEKMTPKNSSADFFRLFLSIIAPGGAQSSVERTQIRNFLDARCGSKTAKVLKLVEEQFSAWGSEQSLNHGPVLKSILELVCTDCTYWVGVSENFPNDGFFIGEPFRIAEAQHF